MKRTVYIALVVFFISIIGYFSYLVLTTRSHSPFDEASISSQGVDISVKYCQPYKKERLVFGEKADGALVPYGAYWRLGANDATEISFSKDVRFGEKMVTAGAYRMYAVPYAERWEISLNSELGQFGYFTPNYELDVLKVNIPVQKSTDFYEQLTMKFEERDAAVFLAIYWDETLIEIPIEVTESN